MAVATTVPVALPVGTKYSAIVRARFVLAVLERISRRSVYVPGLVGGANVVPYMMLPKKIDRQLALGVVSVGAVTDVVLVLLT